MSWMTRINTILTQRRLTYAWITGGILWSAWLLSCLLGPGSFDLAGQVIGTDYLQFYAAGTTLRQGLSADLYNFEYQSQLEQAIVGPELVNYHAFITPPFLAWLYVPFTFLPYTWSFIVWSILGLLLLWLSIKLLASTRPLATSWWALTWFPIFAAISFGQNSLLSLFLFSFTYWLAKKEKYFAAGLVSSLLLFKPQMVLGLGLFWLLEWRKGWKSLLGLVTGGSILAGLCFWLLPDASRSYIDLSRNFLPGMIYQAEFPLIHLHSLRGFWILLFPGSRWLAEGLSLVFSTVGVVAFYYFWRKNRTRSDLLFAATVCLTIWISPHAMVYDWSILIISAILFWRAFPNLRVIWKSLFALIWIAMFLSGPLTLLQQKIFPFALQISVPVFFYSLVVCFRSLMAVPSAQLDITK